MRARALLHVESAVYVSSLGTFGPEQLERWKGTYLPIAVSYVSVTCGCCRRQCLICGSLCSHLCQRVCLWGTHSASLLVQPASGKGRSHIQWPRTETPGSLGTWGWAPVFGQEESLGPGAAGDGSHL